MSGEIVRAPFTPEQVEQLNRYQQGGWMHPFTCGVGTGRHLDLVATEAGWICPDCDYTQDWAHGFMADREVLDSLEASRRELFGS